MTETERLRSLRPAELADDRVNRREAMLGWMEEIAPYGIFTTDADLKIRSWNRWLVAHSGLTPDRVVGRPLLEVFPDLRERRLEEHFHRALGGQIVVLSTALHRYLLPLLPVTREFGVPQMLQTARIAPLPVGGQVVGTISIIEDVTQRECQAHTLRRQQEHDRLLSTTLGLLLEAESPLQAATELFPRIAAPLRLDTYLNYLLSPDGQELRLHAASGLPPEVRRALGRLALGEGPCGRAAQSRQRVQVSDVQGSTSPEHEVIRRLGLRAYLGFPLVIGERLLGTVAFGSYARDGIASDEVEFLSRVAQNLAIALDRTLREETLHDAQRRLSEHAEVLETKIAERTAKLHETIQQLESFSYTVAHDLRAPIRSLKGYSEILLTDFQESIPAEGQSLLQRLHRASHRLDALTRDLLKFSKIARQDVQLTPIDLDELVPDVAHAMPALGGILEIRAPLGHVRAQRTLLQQCFANLFDNALKFGNREHPPRIVVRSEAITAAGPEHPAGTLSPFSPSTSERPTDPRDVRRPREEPAPAPRVRVWVEDNGIGIPPQAHQKIFGIFERVSGLDNVEGTGIGLAIVARAMQQMGGNCGVESAEGSGARFWLDLERA